MSKPFASLTAGMLARKGEAKPSQEPVFGHKPWQPPVAPAIPQTVIPQRATPDHPATLAAIPTAIPVSGAKVRLTDVASVWPSPKPVAQQNDTDGAGWVPARPGQAPSPNQPLKTTIRLTHAQVRAVKLAALVLDKPQQEILTAGLLAKLEALACSDLSNCTCFKAVIEGLKMPDPLLEAPLAY